MICSCESWGHLQKWLMKPQNAGRTPHIALALFGTGKWFSSHALTSRNAGCQRQFLSPVSSNHSSFITGIVKKCQFHRWKQPAHVNRRAAHPHSSPQRSKVEQGARPRAVAVKRAVWSAPTQRLCHSPSSPQSSGHYLQGFAFAG